MDRCPEQSSFCVEDDLYRHASTVRAWRLVLNAFRNRPSVRAGRILGAIRRR